MQQVAERSTVRVRHSDIDITRYYTQVFSRASLDEECPKARVNKLVLEDAPDLLQDE